MTSHPQPHDRALLRSLATMSVVSALLWLLAFVLTAIGHHGHFPLDNPDTQLIMGPPTAWLIILSALWGVVIAARRHRRPIDPPTTRVMRALLLAATVAQLIAAVACVVVELTMARTAIICTCAVAICPSTFAPSRTSRHAYPADSVTPYTARHFSGENQSRWRAYSTVRLPIVLVP
jgi:hypothetical protein